MVFRLEKPKDKVLNKVEEKGNVILSKTNSYPLSSLGYIFPVNRTRSAMEITKKINSDTEFYYVVNPFETTILNYKDSIDSLAKIYLNLKSDNQNLRSPTWYKIWEILFSFDIASDKDINIGIVSNNSKVISDSVESFRDKLISGAKHKIITSDIKMVGGSKKQKGAGLDISLKPNQDLIIADVEFEPTNPNYHEQETYQLFCSEIFNGLSNLNKDGSLVIKIWDTYTTPTLKLLWILSSYFSDTYIYKPSFSRQTTSERYIVCKGFNKSVTASELKIIQQMAKDMDSDDWTFEILPNLELPSSFLNFIKYVNTKIVNQQLITINKLVKYIKENIYFGDAYHQYREKQINNTQNWTNQFFPPSNNLYIKTKDEIEKQIKQNTEKSKAEAEKFASSIIN